MVKKKLNLKNQEIILVEAFLVHNSRTRIFSDMPFSQNDSPERTKKNTFPEKSNDKTFKEIKKFHWAIAPIVQQNQNAAKKSGSVIFIP